ncbi:MULTISPECIES: sensor histidine kinase [unclassified Aureimonas]|uniref:sensor histidine kinase n=1 Tax=unclassified Aureimonas TaxID=2615206 RepID=UPI0006FDF32A|nr:MULTISPECIES: sensor histidine kinase [unclassified Aureimonas]KQT60654.1 hypothetical protein ASG54_24660 [Aureimonas sp. Leaf460]KQT68783.1 hypothetical protein ASG62_18180 [Aureimonas sp. Leaf427]
MSGLRLLVLLILAMLPLSSCATREARLSELLVSEVESFVDPDGSLPIGEIDARRDQLFQPGRSAASRFGLPRVNRTTVWMKIDERAILALAGRGWSEPIVLMLEDNQVREARLVLVGGDALQSQVWKKLNEENHAGEDGFRYPVFLLDPADLSHGRLYLSLRAEGPIVGSPRIADFQSFASIYDGGTRLLTLVIGVRVAIFAYILALGLSLKSRTNLWLAGFVGVTLLLIALNNTIFDFAALPGGVAFTRGLTLGATFLVHLCVIGFAARFLRVHSRAPAVFSVYVVLGNLFIAGTVAATIDGLFDIGIMPELVPYLRIAVLLFTLVAAAAVLPRGPARACGFFLAWTPVMGAVVLRVLQDFAPLWAPQTISNGAMLSGTTLSLALFAVISSIDVQRREARLKANVRHNAERFKAFAEIGTDASWEVDGTGYISFVAGNPAPLARLKLGDAFVECIERATSPEAAAPVRAAIAGRFPFDDVRLRLSDNPNREAWISLSGRPILDRTHALFGGSVYRGLIRDVSDEVERESRRLVEQQVFALGQLAGSVAHEINNLLHPVINLTKRLRARRSSAGDPEGARMLDLIDQSSRQAARVVSELLQTMRGDRGKDVARPLSVALEQALDGIRPALPSGVAIDLVCEPGLYPPVRVGDMLQVLGNLVSNAVHAMDGHGAIRIHLVQTGRVAKMTVADTGQGMPEHVRMRALQPFFSTKTDGRGTGIGLYIVQRIIGDYNGRIAIDSAPGTGTSVTILIPNPGETDDD